MAAKTKHFGGPTTSIRLTASERDIILAALRLWQRETDDHQEVESDLMQIASNGGTHQVLNHGEINALCADLNR